MKAAAIGMICFAVGMTLIVINSYQKHHDTNQFSHSFSHCAAYSDLRCEWALSPQPGRILVLMGAMLVICGFVATVYKYLTNKTQTLML